eukprot:TRINITY_DN1088_c0_g1_i1.p1 TRINITY_DN1088_c0_g1~~TRINITY_DN1088_c0_g1_i1.p1  ORF type:complete len:859 (-),score=139.46 TRINITY_DN1088_c0_g1_i1:340-2607(-)
MVDQAMNGEKEEDADTIETESQPTDTDTNVDMDSSYDQTDESLESSQDPTAVAPPIEYVEPGQSGWEGELLPFAYIKLLTEGRSPQEIEEILQRLKREIKTSHTNALRLYFIEILESSSRVPSQIRRFFPPDLMSNNNKVIHYDSQGISKETVAYFLSQVKQISEADTKAMGIRANVVGSNILHWAVEFSDFPEDSDLSKELKEYAKKYHYGSKAYESVVLEMKFPQNYVSERAPSLRSSSSEIYEPPSNSASGSAQANSPLIRLIRPRVIFPGEVDDSTLEFPSRDQKITDLTVSMNLENGSWSEDPSLLESLSHLRSLFEHSRIDQEKSSKEFYLPTVGSFWKTFTVRDMSECSYPPEISSGGKILLPPSVLGELTQYDFVAGSLGSRYSGTIGMGTSMGAVSHSSNTAMVFEISARSLKSDKSKKEKKGGNGRRTFVGVWEFTAGEGQAVLPHWIMKNLAISPGDQVEIRRVNIARGDYLQLQPHTKDFFNKVKDPKAMLEWVLPNYVALTTGDILVVRDPETGLEHTMNVVSVKPGKAISLVERDINLDFMPAIDDDGKSAFVPSPSASTSSPSKLSPVKESADSQKASSSQKVGSGTDENNQGHPTCDNCHHKIPPSQLSIHTLTCARKNYYCPTCNIVIERSKKDEHTERFHTLVECPLECGAGLMEARDVEGHMMANCVRRVVVCTHCGMSMSFAARMEHEEKCGARTEPCPTCKKRVQKKGKKTLACPMTYNHYMKSQLSFIFIFRS